VVQAELALELFIVELDLPAQPDQARELLGLGVLGQLALARTLAVTRKR
jgi:hypothetical protein